MPQSSSYIPTFLRTRKSRKRILSILIMEASERFSYYGFRAILVLYFLKIGFEESVAISLFAFTTSIAYSSPVLGSILSDGYWGKYKTILFFGLFYWIGLVLLTVGAYLDTTTTSEYNVLTKPFTFLGLFLICLGTGGIKPCVSAFGADQVQAHDDSDNSHTEHDISSTHTSSEMISLNSTSSAVYQHRGLHEDEISEFLSESSHNNDNITETKQVAIQEFFNYFYLMINVGSVFSYLIVPPVRLNFGYAAAFLVPTVFLFISIICFVSGTNDYVINDIPNVDSTSSSSYSLLATFKIIFKLIFQKQSTTQYTQNHQQIEDAKKVIKILPVLCFLPFFWMLYDQHSSVWTLQATNMNLTVSFFSLEFTVQPEQLGIINPVLITILIPIFDSLIYPFLNSHNILTTHLKRMSFGMILTALSFIVCGFVELALLNNNKGEIAVLWQLPQLFIITVSEIFVSVTGLEFSYSYSPKSMKAIVMALYFLTSAAGDFCGGLLYSFLASFRHNHRHGDDNSISDNSDGKDRMFMMFLCAFIMIFNCIVFYVKVVVSWEKQEKEEEQETIEVEESFSLNVEKEKVGQKVR